MIKSNSMTEAGTSKYGEGSSKTHTWSSHKIRLETSSMIATTNPMDNVPFVPSIPLSNGSTSNSTMYMASDSVGNCYKSLDRVQVFLSTPSQSEYNFALEKSVVRESASPWIQNK